MTVSIKKLIDEDNNQFYPVTSLNSVRDENGKTIFDYLQNTSIFLTAETVEDGLFFVDNELNIGFSLDESGAKAKGIITYEIID